MIADKYFIPELIEDEDIIFNKDSEYHSSKKFHDTRTVKGFLSWKCFEVSATFPEKEWA
ncbi:TPA: hypothetical protein ACJXBS_001493 [Streptococcus pneumoniae]